MSNAFPSQFIGRLAQVMGNDYEQVVRSFSVGKKIIYRINTLKIQASDLFALLQEKRVIFDKILWCDYAVMIEDKSEAVSQLIEQGMLYRQNLSSMFVPLVLDPKPDEYVLDLCAAPGSKSSQIASLMENKGELVCIEVVKSRFFRLKAVTDLLGVKNARFHLMDGRRFQARERFFDKILLDAPCSSEGRFDTTDADSMKYWSLRKVKEMQQKQRGLILHAFRQLKKGGILVYSTCTFSPEENEDVINWLIKKKQAEMEILPVELPSQIKKYPCVLQWNKKIFDESVAQCVRILPDEAMEGFFIAKIKKL